MASGLTRERRPNAVAIPSDCLRNVLRASSASDATTAWWCHDRYQNGVLDSRPRDVPRVSAIPISVASKHAYLLINFISISNYLLKSCSSYKGVRISVTVYSLKFLHKNINCEKLQKTVTYSNKTMTYNNILSDNVNKQQMSKNCQVSATRRTQLQRRAFNVTAIR